MWILVHCGTDLSAAVDHLSLPRKEADLSVVREGGLWVGICAPSDSHKDGNSTVLCSFLGLIVDAGVEVTRKRMQINRFSEKNAKVSQSSWCLSDLSLASLVRILVAEWAGVIKRLALILTV